jgi:hypothetical protein
MARWLRVSALCISLFTSGCAHGRDAEASCNLEPKNLPTLLKAIKPLIEKGYGEAEIQALQRFAAETPVRETRTTTLPITYQGREARSQEPG